MLGPGGLRARTGMGLKNRAGEIHAKGWSWGVDGSSQTRVQPGRPESHLKYWMPTISHQARARSTARPSGSVHW
jgi:hypothetical protein